MSAAWQRALFWLGGLALLILALTSLSGMLLPFAAGLTIAYFLDPVCRRLQRLGLPRSLASALTLVIFVHAIGLIFLILVPLLETQILDLVQRIPRLVAAAQRELNALTGMLEQRLAPEDYAKLREAVSAKLGDAFGWVGRALTGLLSGGLAVFNILSLVFITPVIAFFLLRDWPGIIARLDEWLPRRHEATIRAQAALVDETLAGFIHGQTTVCAVMGAYYALALSLVGLDFGLIVGVLVGFLIFIPVIGGAIGAVLGILLALAQFDGLVRVGIVAAIFAVGQAIEGNVLTPKLVGERVNLHPVWVIFALLAFGELFGLLGLLIAVPVAAVIGVITRFAMQRYLASPLYDPAFAETTLAAPEVAAPSASAMVDDGTVHL
jgi:predicted PurR-regulated permease PerM